MYWTALKKNTEYIKYAIMQEKTITDVNRHLSTPMFERLLDEVSKTPDN